MIAWQDAYSVGNEDIDTQHKIFMKLINQFSDARAQGQSKERLTRILEEIFKYAEFHFCSEENFMATHDVSVLEHHKELHKVLLQKLSDYFFGFRLDECSSIEVEDFLFDWFSTHTLEQDKHYAVG